MGQGGLTSKGLKMMITRKKLVILAVTLFLLAGAALFTYVLFPKYHFRRINEIALNLSAFSSIDPISPDGKWLAANDDVGVSIEAVDLPFRKQSFSLPERGWQLDWHVWSPDSKAFLVSGRPAKSCGQKYALLSEDNGRWSSPYYYQPDFPLGTDFFEAEQWSPKKLCTEVSWSEDGTLLAIYTTLDDKKDVVWVDVVDHQMRIVRQMTVAIPVANFLEVYWRGTDYLFTSISTSTRLLKSQVYAVSALKPGEVTPLLTEDGYLNIAGEEDATNRLLFLSSISSHPYTCKVIVFNRLSRQVEKEFVQEGHCYYISQSTDNRSIATIIERIYDCPGCKDSNVSHEKRLFTWAWDSLALTDRGVIADLDGWHDDLQGFLVKRWRNEKEGEFYVEVVRPE